MFDVFEEVEAVLVAEVNVEKDELRVVGENLCFGSVEVLADGCYMDVWEVCSECVGEDLRIGLVVFDDDCCE